MGEKEQCWGRRERREREEKGAQGEKGKREKRGREGAGEAQGELTRKEKEGGREKQRRVRGRWKGRGPFLHSCGREKQPPEFLF